jgi:hypothetical protein
MQALRQWSFARVLLLSAGWILVCVLTTAGWLFIRFRTASNMSSRQCVVDSKIAVRFEWLTSSCGVVLDEWSRGFTDERGEHACVGVQPDVIAAPEKQAPTSDLDAAVGFDVGPEIANDPDLTPGGSLLSRRSDSRSGTFRRRSLSPRRSTPG